MAQLSKTILYARVSSVGQKQGTGLQRQIECGHAYAQQHGWTVDGEIADDGRSAFHGHHRTKGKLGIFERDALEGLENGTRLICENLDRMSRGDPQDSYDFIRSLTRNGVAIVTYQDGETYDATTDMFKIIKQLMIFHRSNEESEAKSKRSKANWKIKHERAAKEGKALSKRCKPWLEVVDGQYVLNAARQSLLIDIFTRADAGDGTTAITKMLNQTVKPWGTAHCWHRSKVIALLCDRAVIGEHVMPNGEIVKLYPAAIAADVFERVCANAMSRKDAKGGRKSGKVANLLSGLCRCDVCGASMQYVGAGYLKCSKALVGACTSKASVAYAPLEKAVLDTCLHLALDDNAFTNRGEVQRLNVLIAERSRDLKAAQDKARSLMDLYSTQQSKLAMQMAVEAEQRAEELEANVNALVQQREHAKGRASNLEHMKRVTDMRKHLATDVTLRKRVAQGFHTLIREVRFTAEGEVSLMFVAGAALLRFDRKAQLIAGFDLVKDGRADVPQLAAYAKRRAAAKEAGTLFTEAVSATA